MPNHSTSDAATSGAEPAVGDVAPDVGLPSAGPSDGTGDGPALGGARMPSASHPIRRPRWRYYTAFVLSGGGARGALQVGALRALLERGITPDVLVGTSAGAWNSVFFARNPTIEGIQGLTDVWRSLNPLNVLLGREAALHPPSQAITGALMLSAAHRVTRGAPSLYGDGGLRQFLGTHLGGVTFEELQVPTHVVATDLTNGTRAVFSSGDVQGPLLASAAIPGIFPPVYVGDHVYVDGGAIDNCSIETALALGARRIFIVDCGYDERQDAYPSWQDGLGLAHPAQAGASGNGASGVHGKNGRRHDPRQRTGSAHALAVVLERTTQVMARYQLQRALDRLPRGIEAHLLRPPANLAGGALDFGHAGQWIDAAYEAARGQLRDVAPDPLPVPTPQRRTVHAIARTSADDGITPDGRNAHLERALNEEAEVSAAAIG